MLCRNRHRSRFMKNLFGTPLWWAEHAVGSLRRFLVMAAAQIVASLFICAITQWKAAFLIGFFTVVLPVFFMHALRQALLEGHQLRKDRETPLA